MKISLTDRREIGKTGIEVSPIGFGASPLGSVFGDIDVSNTCTAQSNVSDHIPQRISHSLEKTCF